MPVSVAQARHGATETGMAAAASPRAAMPALSHEGYHRNRAYPKFWHSDKGYLDWPVRIPGFLGSLGGDPAEGAGESMVHWPGTGRHQAVAVSSSYPREIFGHLVAAGLVTVDGNGRAGLTEVARRFLDHLHPDCEDPDIMVRWRDPVTGLIRNGAEPSVDAWTKRFFGRAKNKLDRSRVRPSADAP
jgi:hypothetical protein